MDINTIKRNLAPLFNNMPITIYSKNKVYNVYPNLDNFEVTNDYIQFNELVDFGSSTTKLTKLNLSDIKEIA